MTRVISLFLPTLSTDRVRRKAGDAAPPAETPLILVGRDGRRRVVLAADAAARQRACASACPRPRPRRWCRASLIQDADPAGDAEALDRLALWMLRASRRSSPPMRRTESSSTPPAPIICMAARTRCLPRCSRSLAASASRARAAIADSWGAAHALARFAARPATLSEPGKADGDVASSSDRRLAPAGRHGRRPPGARLRAHRRLAGATARAARAPLRP